MSEPPGDLPPNRDLSRAPAGGPVIDNVAPNLRADIRSSDGLVVTPVIADWPSRCVVCNAEVPAATQNFGFTWNHPLAFLWLLLGPGIGVLILFFFGKKVRLLVGMCGAHQATRTRNRLILGGLLVGGVAGLCGGTAGDSEVAALLGLPTMLAGLVAYLLLPRPLRVQKVEGDLAWVVAGAPFVESLRQVRRGLPDRRYTELGP